MSKETINLYVKAKPFKGNTFFVVLQEGEHLNLYCQTNLKLQQTHFIHISTVLVPVDLISTFDLVGDTSLAQ